MFGTIIIDAYKEDETKEMAEALNEICCPNDNYGWSSAGIYCFWDYYTKEIYYIGLAVDLRQRFMQHNGLILIQEGSCKYKKIKEYFQAKDKLGYTIFVQSPLSQPVNHRNRSQYSESIFTERNPGDIGKDDITMVEGTLLEAYRQLHSRYPLWNKMGGSIRGKKLSTLGNYGIVQSFTDLNPNLLVSHSTIKEIAANPTYERYESFLHAPRMAMLLGRSFDSELRMVRKYTIESGDVDTYGEIIETKYLDKALSL